MRAVSDVDFLYQSLGLKGLHRLMEGPEMDHGLTEDVSSIYLMCKHLLGNSMSQGLGWLVNATNAQSEDKSKDKIKIYIKRKHTS